VISLSLAAVGLALLVAAPAVQRAIFKRADAEGFDGDPEKRLAAWRKAAIVAFALRGAGGLIGLVLTATTGNSWWAWGLGGAALITMALDWPRHEHLGMDQTPGPK
jgi:hypothetical protein